MDVPYWERDTERLARQLAQALTSVGWSVPVDGQGQTRFYSRNAKLPVGIVVSRKEDTPAFVSIAMALLKIFGKESISGFRDATLADGFIKITVWRKPLSLQWQGLLCCKVNSTSRRTCKYGVLGVYGCM